MKKKMNHAATSLAFNPSGDLLAVSSYSSNEIEVYKSDDLTLQKTIKLTESCNPLNSLIWNESHLISIDDMARKISFINYDLGCIDHQFEHEHARSFESIDYFKDCGFDLLLASSNKIHPPTLNRLKMDVSYKELHNVYLINALSSEVRSTSVLGNVVQAKLFKYDASDYAIIAVSRSKQGTAVVFLNSDFEVLKEHIVSDIGTANVFISISNLEITVICQLNQLNEKTICIKYDRESLENTGLKTYTESKFEKSKPYLNSVFSDHKISLTECYLRNDMSHLQIIDQQLNQNLFEVQSEGFMEAVAISATQLAWSESNDVVVVSL